MCVSCQLTHTHTISMIGSLLLGDRLCISRSDSTPFPRCKGQACATVSKMPAPALSKEPLSQKGARTACVKTLQH